MGQEVNLAAIGATIGAFILAIIAAWFTGRRSTKADKLQDYRETRERIDNAPDIADADDARKRMRERKP
jgi:hypothetical protein